MRSRPVTTTRVPLARSDSAMFSARSRHAAQDRNSGSPSRHVWVFASYTRGLTAMLNRHSAAPPEVNRSSGLSVRFPTAVIEVSFTVLLLLSAVGLVVVV